MVRFWELKKGETFDFIEPYSHQNTFFLRCEKISPRKYRDEKGVEHRVGTIYAKVYHVGD